MVSELIETISLNLIFWMKSWNLSKVFYFTIMTAVYHMHLHKQSLLISMFAKPYLHIVEHASSNTSRYKYFCIKNIHVGLSHLQYHHNYGLLYRTFKYKQFDMCMIYDNNSSVEIMVFEVLTHSTWITWSNKMYN